MLSVVVKVSPTLFGAAVNRRAGNSNSVLQKNCSMLMSVCKSSRLCQRLGGAEAEGAEDLHICNSYDFQLHVKKLVIHSDITIDPCIN